MGVASLKSAIGWYVEALEQTIFRTGAEAHGAPVGPQVGRDLYKPLWLHQLLGIMLLHCPAVAVRLPSAAGSANGLWLACGCRTDDITAAAYVLDVGVLQQKKALNALISSIRNRSLPRSGGRIPARLSC
jgi:hypothetical protein